MVQAVSLSFEQSKMNSFLTKGQLFSRPEIFLRELIKNAYDACKMREALEQSWGLAFLEQISAPGSTVHTSYQPRLYITYDSKAAMLTVEDNGFGINEEDLKKYVVNFGQSYYTSEDFKKQQLEYDPISRDGIGLYSCFMASRAILIESKKHHSINTAWLGKNKQSLDPIAVKWFENSDKMEYIKSNKEAAGTRISLALKSFLAKKMSFDFLVETIQHDMLEQTIPIVVRVDDQTVTLDRRISGLVNPFENILGVTGIPIREKWIEGYLVLYTSRQKYLVGTSTVYEKGFRLLDNGDDLDLCPAWLGSMHYSLNFRQHYLTRMLSGDGIVKNDQWEHLRQTIGKLIMKAFKNNSFALVQYLADGEKNMLTEYEDEMTLLCKAVHADVYLEGKEVELSMEQIFKGFYGRKLVIARIPKGLFQFYQKTYPAEFQVFTQTYPLILFERNYKAFSQLLAPYMVKQEYVMPGLPGIQYIQMEVDFSEKRDYVPYINHYEFYPKQCPVREVFCYVINERPECFELYLNQKHPMVQLLEKKKQHPRVNWLYGVIVENIKYRIRYSQNLWKNIMDFGGIRVDPWTSDEPVTVRARWSLEEDFAEALNKFIHTQFRPIELRELGIENLEFQKEDFIQWWYSKH